MRLNELRETKAIRFTFYKPIIYMKEFKEATMVSFQPYSKLIK
jgi:hypothetical protein